MMSRQCVTDRCYRPRQLCGAGRDSGQTARERSHSVSCAPQLTVPQEQMRCQEKECGAHEQLPLAECAPAKAGERCGLPNHCDRLAITPFFMTNRTLRRVRMSLVGSPSTAMMSAR